MKRWILFCTALVMLIFLCLPAQAAGSDPHYIWDEAGLLTVDQRLALEEAAREISEAFRCGVYFVSVDDYRDFSREDVFGAAITYYKDHNFGYGSDDSGVMLMLSMDDRDYSLIAYGFGNTAFTDYGKDLLAEEFLDDFADDDWFGGCDDYIETCGEYLELARDDTPVDRGTTARNDNPMHALFCSLLLGFPLALLICKIWQWTAKKKVYESKEARTFVAENSFRVTGRRDLYTHTTQTRTKIERSSGSGGTTVRSSGFSGKSGKF